MTERTYTDPDCLAFVEWAEDSGLEVQHYEGRFFWKGPAVRLDYVGEAVGIPVPFQHDSLGLGVIVYPVSSDGGTEGEYERT